MDNEVHAQSVQIHMLIVDVFVYIRVEVNVFRIFRFLKALKSSDQVNALLLTTFAYVKQL